VIVFDLVFGSLSAISLDSRALSVKPRVVVGWRLVGAFAVIACASRWGNAQGIFSKGLPLRTGQLLFVGMRQSHRNGTQKVGKLAEGIQRVEAQRSFMKIRPSPQENAEAIPSIRWPCAGEAVRGQRGSQLSPRNGWGDYARSALDPTETAPSGFTSTLRTPVT